MKRVVKGSIRDLAGFLLHLNRRRRLFRRADAGVLTPGPMNLLSRQLHPRRQDLKIADIRQETPLSRTYRLVPADPSGSLACFRAGQYLALEDTVEDTRVSRPFSICSAPDEALDGGYYEITVKTAAAGFFAPWAVDHWQIGKVLRSSEPTGTFYYEPLRDATRVVCLAGGSGITPFRSIIRDALLYSPDTRFTLFYGIDGLEEMMFRQEFEGLQQEYPDRFSMVPVCSGGADEWQGETGFITADLIRRYLPDIKGASFFLCGPPAMGAFLSEELKAFNLTPRRFRQENYGRPPVNAPEGRVFTITLVAAGREIRVPAEASETVLTALERAGLNPPALCRSGECGWCRSRLLSGELYVPPGNDGRRKADIKFGWFHPCSSWPLSDLLIEVPINPVNP